MPRPSGSRIGSAALLLLLGAAAGAPLWAADRPPNIVLVLVDDQRFDALGVEGHPFLDTPHLDALASRGIVFENAFVTTSLCSPSRASILTGRYAHRHGVLDNQTRLDPSIPTFPQVLQRLGYRTAFVGKWHMGGGDDSPRPGFDRWVSFRGQGVYYDPTFNVDGERIQRDGYVTDLITDYAVDFIRQERDRPFMLYVGHKAVHADFYPAERHDGVYDGRQYVYPDSMADSEENYASKPDWVRRQRNSWHGVDGMYNGAVDFDQFTRDYAETLLAVDESVERIVDALRSEGLLESTLLVYTSDNGFLFGEHGTIDKRSMYEASIRIPLIVHCPELFEGGQRRSEMILNVDFAPTFLEAAGLPIPETVQGQSFYGLLTGARSDWRNAFLYEYFWERAFPQTPTVLGVRTDRYKFMRFHGIWDKYELYDLDADPDEQINLLGSFIQHNEAGQLDGLIRQTADPDLRALYDQMDSELTRLAGEVGIALEPNWTPVR